MKDNLGKLGDHDPFFRKYKKREKIREILLGYNNDIQRWQNNLEVSLCWIIYRPFYNFVIQMANVLAFRAQKANHPMIASTSLGDEELDIGDVSVP